MTEQPTADRRHCDACGPDVLRASVCRLMPRRSTWRGCAFAAARLRPSSAPATAPASAADRAAARSRRASGASTGWPIASHIFRTCRLRPSRSVIAQRRLPRRRAVRQQPDFGRRGPAPVDRRCRAPAARDRARRARRARAPRRRARPRGAGASAAPPDRRRWSGAAALRTRSRAGRPDRRIRARRAADRSPSAAAADRDRVVT